MKKRLFYIIGHNPNTIPEVRAFLSQGANAIEPDVHFDSKVPPGKAERFYVGHVALLDRKIRYPLVRFLADLDVLLRASPGYEKRFCLIAFDTKTRGFPIDEFMGIVEQNFMNRPGNAGISVLVTRGALDDPNFLKSYTGHNPRVCVGIDEWEYPVEVLNAARDAQLDRVCVAYGITEIVVGGIRLPMDEIRPHTYSVITEALGHRVLNRYCSVVYPWVVMGEAEMKRYLQLRVDGMIVKSTDVKPLVKLLQGTYSAEYEIASAGDDPFIQDIPSYRLCVTTARSFLGVMGYGTDAPITFTLKGTIGANSVTIEATRYNMMEEGSLNYVVIEGVDVGVPQELVIKLGKSGAGPDWNPETIEIRTNTSDWSKTLQLRGASLSAGSTQTYSLL